MTLEPPAIEPNVGYRSRYYRLIYSLNQPIIIVYQKGDIVKQPLKKGSFVPKNVPGVGWGGSCRDVVGHGGVGLGHVEVGWVM